MPEYLHGAYGMTNAVSSRVSDKADSAVVVFGTAPVGQVDSGNVNKPVLVNNIAEARKLFGYSDNWEKYTLCEAFRVFFELNAVGPLVVVNVLDPATHKKSSPTTKSLTPANGKIVIAGAEDAIVSTLTVGTKVLGTDYTVSFNAENALVITETAPGKLGTSALSISYSEMDASAVDASDLVGTTDDMGLNTGLYAIKNVYNTTGMIPSYMIAPGWSSNDTVHGAMKSLSRKISGHWDAWIFADMPLKDNATDITLATAATYKAGHGYTAENESVYFPMAEGVDGRKYHLATIAAANFLSLLVEYEGLPYHTASNTVAGIIANLYMGTGNDDRVYDDEIINKYPNKSGINSAAYVSGNWVIWGAHAADYDFGANNTAVNVAETTRMMLYYISNDFQSRRNGDVDQPMTANDIAAIVADEQSRLDALVSVGALTYGTASLNAELMTNADVMAGDWAFAFDVTTTPLAKSLTAVVNWVEDGFATYFANEE